MNQQRTAQTKPHLTKLILARVKMLLFRLARRPLLLAGDAAAPPLASLASVILNCLRVRRVGDPSDASRYRAGMLPADWLLTVQECC